MNFSGIIGLIGFWGLLGLAIIMSAGGGSVIFVHPPSAILVVGLAGGIGLMAFGLRGMVNGLFALRVLIIRVPDDALGGEQVEVIRGLISATYGAGAITMLTGCIILLVQLDDPSQMGVGVAIALLSMFYSALLAEGILRPAARHIEHRTSASVNDLRSAT
ncbi:hypothetical protein ACFL1X_01260 [Candidatus Hydrogenedentota bacterium]